MENNKNDVAKEGFFTKGVKFLKKHWKKAAIGAGVLLVTAAGVIILGSGAPGYSEAYTEDPDGNEPDSYNEVEDTEE